MKTSLTTGYHDHEYVVTRLSLTTDKDVLNNVKIYTSSERRVIVSLLVDQAHAEHCPNLCARPPRRRKRNDERPGRTLSSHLTPDPTKRSSR